ncbi:MAG: hypothetical protein V9G25_09420 [Acidimicrobiia bacterium]
MIGEISARVGVVLAPGSVERVELPGVVAGLESAILKAGGGEVGRRLVVSVLLICGLTVLLLCVLWM